MTNTFDTNALVNNWMNGRRQFWDLWLDGISPFIEAENKLLHMEGSKQLEDTLRAFTHTTIDTQEKMLVDSCEHFSKIPGQTNNTTSDDIFKFWKKELNSITDLQKKSLLGESPLSSLYNPQKMLEKVEELTSIMNKNVDAMKQSVEKDISEQIFNPPIAVEIPSEKTKAKHKSNTKPNTAGNHH